MMEITDPISNMKSPMPLGFYKDVWDHFSVSTWNSGSDHEKSLAFAGAEKLTAKNLHPNSRLARQS